MQLQKFTFAALSLLLTGLLFASSPAPAQPKEVIISKKAQDSLLLDAVQLGSGRIVTLGERGHILISDDNGESWQQVPTPTRDTLTAVDFIDDKNGVAVGFEQSILVTRDGGESWQLKHHLENAFDQPAFFDVEYLDQNRVIAIGAYGLYFESEDGAETWQAQEFESLADIYGGFSHFYGFTQVGNSEQLYLAGEKYVASEDQDGVETSTGLLAMSADGGKSWKKLSSPYNGSFFGIAVSADQQVFAYGLKGNLYRSSDQGLSWNKLNTNSASGLHDIVFDGQNDWYLVGTSGTLIEGKTLVINKRSDLKGRAAILLLDDGQLLIVGEGGVEKRSSQLESKAAAETE
ncbi:YCF48-related protein [Kangiella sp. TOML190]|uniref:WD40/YVTN/BNR-like repeat-containing protein n=1 Tax=Kangiella sp. TOML190 TaxID=2931351 RepID=UPI00203F9ED6|nr:YCF48-related protein [Kangiella sp. TOML190]